ncbi:MAG: energy transducer TonB [Terriglobales bacterium]
MFSTLESTWDQSARRGRATLASFALQALALSLLLAIPLLTIQGPPKLHWFDESPLLAPPPAPAPPAGGPRPIHSSNISPGGELLQPPTIPPTVANLHEEEGPVASSPDVSGLGVDGGTGTGRHGVWRSLGPSVEVAPPPTPAPTRPLRISHWAEGNLIYRVQPIYPPLARQARIQGTVELRAIVSKAGTIENLAVVSGHPMLVKSALEAVRQWRYRPYLLNSEPIEVETEITVNFLLSGN